MATKKKTVKQGRYEYVPAALNSNSFGGLGLYTRYGKTGTNKIEVVEQNPQYLWVKCPDRELVFVGDSHREHSWAPSGGTWDDYLNLSVFHEEAAKDFHLKYFMTNFTEFMGARDKKSLNSRQHQAHQPGTPRIISDSGGFQLMMGKLDYVNPAEAVDWYKRNVDIGIVLDIPAWGSDRDLLMRMARVQKLNTQIMLDASEGHTLELMNIFHGNSSEHRRDFRKIVETDKIKRLAVAGAYNKSIMTSMHDLLTIASTGQQYKQYHLLGVTNFLQVVPLMRMAHKGLIEHITSDSATHINKAFKKEYLHQAQVDTNIVHLQIGRTHVNPSIGNLLPCSCPVCSRVHYTDVFSLLDGMAINGILAWHNMYANTMYINRMRDVVGLPIKELEKIIRSQLGTRHGVKEAVEALKYVDQVEQDGLVKANKHYEFYIQNAVQHSEEVSLFTGVEVPNDAEYAARLDRILTHYEQGTKDASGTKNVKVKLKLKRSQAKSHSLKKKKRSKKTSAKAAATATAK